MKTRLDAEPRSLNQFNGLNTATISLVPMPGVAMQEALDYLDSLQEQLLPPGFSVDYSGQARSFLQSGNTLVFAFLLSLLTIYLFLVAQFESLRDPLVVLVTVPMSLCRAIGTLFTLFILPVVYTYIAERRQGVVSQARGNMLVQVGE